MRRLEASAIAHHPDSMPPPSADVNDPMAYSAPLDVYLLRASPDISFGINIEFMEDTHGMPEVTSMRPGGLAETSGMLATGDILTAVNGVDISR